MCQAYIWPSLFCVTLSCVTLWLFVYSVGSSSAMVAAFGNLNALRCMQQSCNIACGTNLNVLHSVFMPVLNIASGAKCSRNTKGQKDSLNSTQNQNTDS